MKKFGETKKTPLICFNKQTENMNNATTTNDFTATLTAKFYAIEVTFEREIWGEVSRAENVRLEWKGRTAFAGGRAKSIAKQWRAQAIAKGIRIESMKFVAI